ncbi:alpha/beta-hydrolase [Trichodelitschia bisporula]|uniref:Alpha/beta-hydrolase n=1 Tax=Trichodelitschia bisporula TaxID=703511 RepID=A0A6G1HIT5_9PEZI|nr:alpha/beta-hydrolase [Trichodelitschia bisporula]
MLSSVALFAVLVPAALAQGGCSPLELIYARATTEPPAKYSAGQFDTAAARSWSKGYGAAGYSLFTNVSALIPGATGYPVHYPADMGGSSPNEGTADMLKHIEERAKACPQQKYALGGHSQGGFVTTGAIPKMPANILSRIVAVTMFGSPACPTQVRNRCISYCQSGDSVCASRGGGSPKGAKGAKLGGLVEREALWAMAAPECAQYASKPTSGLGKGGHLGYNADGLYVRAAACYIAAQFNKGGGAAGGAAALEQ